MCEETVRRLRRDIMPFGYGHHRGLPPSMPGLYSIWLRGSCLYVGMSEDLRRRIREHETCETNPDLSRYIRTYAREIGISTAPADKADLPRLEACAIRVLGPVTNMNAGGGRRRA